MDATRRIILSSFVSLVGLAIVAPLAQADHRRDPYGRTEGRAEVLAAQSRALYDEIRTHFRGQPFMARLNADVMSLYRSARRMEGYARARSNPTTLEREMSRMESTFHDVETGLRNIGRHHGGHWHVRDLTRRIDALVHELHDDVHRLCHPGNQRPIYGGPVYGRPVTGGGTSLTPGDWYFGGGGFSLRIDR